MENINDKIKDMFKKPDVIKPINTTIIRSMWRTIGDSLCEGKETFKVDDLVKKFVSYFETATDKGIAVLGGVGVGKSLNFLIYQRVRSAGGESMTVICMDVKEIEHNFKLKGQEFIEQLINVPELIINDIGTDTGVLKHYGTNSAIIDEILTLRYIKWQKVGGAMKTHISSNLTPSEFKTIYGDRITDRLNEMFFIINVDEKQESYR